MTWGTSQYFMNTSSNTGTWLMPTVSSGGRSIGFSTDYVSPPRERTPLEWLDAEVEKTCALAR